MCFLYFSSRASQVAPKSPTAWVSYSQQRTALLLKNKRLNSQKFVTDLKFYDLVILAKIIKFKNSTNCSYSIILCRTMARVGIVITATNPFIESKPQVYVCVWKNSANLTGRSRKVRVHPTSNGGSRLGTNQPVRMRHETNTVGKCSWCKGYTKPVAMECVSRPHCSLGSL